MSSDPNEEQKPNKKRRNKPGEGKSALGESIIAKKTASTKEGAKKQAKKQTRRGTKASDTAPVESAEPNTLRPEREKLPVAHAGRTDQALESSEVRGGGRVLKHVFWWLGAFVTLVTLFQLRPRLKATIGDQFEPNDAFRRVLLTNTGFFAAHNVSWFLHVDEIHRETGFAEFGNTMRITPASGKPSFIKKLSQDESSTEILFFSPHSEGSSRILKGRVQVVVEYYYTPLKFWKQKRAISFDAVRSAAGEVQWVDSQKSDS